MPRLFLFHLLEFCLLLNQFSRAVAAKWKDDVIKLCGRELVRAQIAICGMSTWSKRSLSQEDAPQTPRPVAEIVPSFINKDTETIIIMLEFIANLPPELKAALSERQPSLPELQHLKELMVSCYCQPLGAFSSLEVTIDTTQTK
eukprot:XP_016870496.1 prorelaxin H1 isoform X3 [Homo sapiens]